MQTYGDSGTLSPWRPTYLLEINRGNKRNTQNKKNIKAVYFVSAYACMHFSGYTPTSDRVKCCGSPIQTGETLTAYTTHASRTLSGTPRAPIYYYDVIRYIPTHPRQKWLCNIIFLYCVLFARTAAFPQVYPRVPTRRMRAAVASPNEKRRRKSPPHRRRLCTPWRLRRRYRLHTFRNTPDTISNTIFYRNAVERVLRSVNEKNSLSYSFFAFAGRDDKRSIVTRVCGHAVSYSICNMHPYFCMICFTHF